LTILQWAQEAKKKEEARKKDPTSPTMRQEANEGSACDIHSGLGLMFEDLEYMFYYHDACESRWMWSSLCTLFIFEFECTCELEHKCVPCLMGTRGCLIFR